MTTATTTKKKRVLLVEPSSVRANVFSAYAGLPLLGPMYLGTILDRAGFDVSVVNEDLLGRDLEVTDLDADALCLTCLTSTVERGYEIADQFKRVNPHGKVLMGGPHVSFMQEEALEHADHVVTGEGEEVIVDLLSHGTDEPVVAGAPVRNLDSLPFIDWSLLVNHHRLKVQPIMLSRGCPFDCNFCSVTAMFGRRYRTMSVERVLEEVDRARIPNIFFYDDNFAAKKSRTHAILDGLEQRIGPRMRWWSAQVRADVTRDEALLAKMRRAGCARVYVGFESINDKSLEEMHKGQSADDVREAVRRFHEHVIRVHGMFIFGADADDERVLRETADFVCKERLDSVQYMILTPFPGTELYDTLEAEGRLLHKKWRYYDALHVVFRPKNLAPYRLQKVAIDTYADYYNVIRALNDGLEAGVGVLARMAGRAVDRLGAPSPWNVVYKLMGSRIVHSWMRSNSGYIDYLKMLPAQA
jgi:radical SAM superfamily enzyme YgiQ (UPF0313 family)